MATLVEGYSYPGWWNLDLAVRFLLKDIDLSSEHYEIIFANGSVITIYKSMNSIAVWNSLQGWINKNKLK